MVHAIEKLERKRLVKRESLSNDRETSFIYSTEAGLLKVDELLHLTRAFELSPKQQESLREYTTVGLFYEESELTVPGGGSQEE